MPGSLLRVVSGAGAGREIAVDDELVLGREAPGAGRLDGEPALSRRHARIARGRDGVLTIEDLGSLNGTYVNGHRIEGATALRAGDEVRLGATVLRVCGPGEPAPAPRSQDTVVSGSPRAARAGGRGVSPARPVEAAAGPPPRPPLRGGGPARPAAAVALGLVALAGLIVVLGAGPGGGGGDERRSAARAGRAFTAQLVVRPSAVVRRLADAVPSTAPPRAGGGIVVDARRGLILTADRLVAGAAAIGARFGPGPARRATLVARAPCDAIALVRVARLPSGARAAPLGSAAELSRGDAVFALARRGARVGRSVPRAARLSAVRGRVAGGRARAALDPAEPRLAGLLLHTARVGPGGAGGPLVDGDGDVVAVNLLAPDRARLRGALPVERVRRRYGELVTGRTERDAGWRLEPWSEVRGRGAAGLLVTGVDRGGPAARATLPARVRARAARPSTPLLGATVFAVNGVAVRRVADVCRALAGVRRGARVSVRADVSSPVLAGRGVGRPSRARAVVLRVRL